MRIVNNSGPNQETENGINIAQSLNCWYIKRDQWDLNPIDKWGQLTGD